VETEPPFTGVVAPIALQRQWAIEIGVVFCLGVLPDAVPILFHSVLAGQGGTVTETWQLEIGGLVRAMQRCAIPLYLIYRSALGFPGFGFRRPRVNDLVTAFALAAVSIATYFLSAGISFSGSLGRATAASAPSGTYFLYALLGLLPALAARELVRVFLLVRLAQLFDGTAIPTILVSLMTSFYWLFSRPSAMFLSFIASCAYCGFFLMERRLLPLVLGAFLANLAVLVIR